MKTQIIAGKDVSLPAGRCFFASRPIAESGRTTYPIYIYNIDGGLILTLDDMPLDEANQFLAEFNNGAISFDGRQW